MIKIPNIDIQAYDYPLQDHQIAQYPLRERDQSKLIIFKNDKIESSTFEHITDYLPADSLLVYNETKVVQARIPFQKKTGARIEIFCLEPIKPTQEIQEAFALKSGVTWKCLVGNSKKWKEGKLELTIGDAVLYAERIDKELDYSFIEFTWNPKSLSFAEILDRAGNIPLPPYMKREAEEIDKQTYQTIFAKQKGSVAAPTAGLHFTEGVFQSLEEKNIKREAVTLHVGAGTFKPVTASSIEEHIMHSEQIWLEKSTIQNLYDYRHKTIIPVGTTTVRTLESLYWFGVKLIKEQSSETTIHIHQWDPYNSEFQGVSKEDSLKAILEMMEKEGLEIVKGETQLMIAPPYQFRLVNSLITNFHQPKSTLLLLVSAMIGDKWKEVYDYALKNDFRFLSYGDACYFEKNKK